MSPTSSHLPWQKVVNAAKKEGRSESLQDGLRDLLSAMFQFACDHDYVKANPMRSIPASMKPVVRNQRAVFCPKPEQVEAVLAAATAGTRPYFATLAETGARASEVLALRWCDVSFEDNTISITAQIHRGGTERVQLKTTAHAESYR